MGFGSWAVYKGIWATVGVVTFCVGLAVTPINPVAGAILIKTATAMEIKAFNPIPTPDEVIVIAAGPI